MNRSFWLGFLLLFIVALVPLLLYALLSPPAANLQEIAQRTANELDRLIQLRQQQVFTIAAFPSIRAYASSSPELRSQRAAIALNELQSWVSSDTNVREVFVTDAQGIVIMATREGWNDNVSNRKFVQDALSGQLAVSPVTRDRGEFSIYYASPVLDNAREIAGALVIRVAAQELWDITPRGENYYAVLSDENGVRLDDSGAPTNRLASFAPLDVALATHVLNEQTYGAELPQVRSTNLPRAQQLVVQGAIDQVSAVDLNAGAVAGQRLVSKSWYVFVVNPQSPIVETLLRLLVPALVAVVLACGGAFLLSRLQFAQPDRP